MPSVTVFLIWVVLLCAATWASTYLVEADEVLADKYRPSTGVELWDQFYAETQEIPVSDQVIP